MSGKPRRSVDASPPTVEETKPLVVLTKSNSVLSQDSELDDYDQEHQQFLNPKYGKYYKRSKAHGRFLRCLVFAGIIGIITTSVIIARKNREHASSWTQKSTVYLPPAPIDIGGKCNGHSNNLIACQQACEVAECCDYPANYHLSCLAGNEKECLKYHKGCSFLSMLEDKKGAVPTIPKAPDNLAQICAPESLARDASQCIQQCIPYECCYKQGVASCTDQETCADYNHCLNLDNIQEEKANIEAVILDKCSPDQITTFNGKRACINVCVVARCCFQNDGEDCFFKDSDFCAQYEACNIVYGDPNTSPAKPVDPAPQPNTPAAEHAEFPPVPDDLGIICDRVFLDDKNSYAQCKEKCLAAQCCNFSPDDSRSCLSGNMQQCFQYHKICSILNIDGGKPAGNNLNPDENHLNGVEDTDGVTLVCGVDSLTMHHGWHLCHDVCHQAECCYKHDGPLCPDASKCIEFATCNNLNMIAEIDDTIKYLVNNKCTPDKLKTDKGRAGCKASCKMRMCCFEEDPCWDLENSADYCPHYEACRQFHTEETEDEDQDDDDDDDNVDHEEGGVDSEEDADEEDTSVTIQPADSIVLNDQCSISSLTNDAGRQRCRDQCDPVACCWDTEENLKAEGKKSCRSHENCGGYGVCLNLRAYEETDKHIKDNDEEGDDDDVDDDDDDVDDDDEDDDNVDEEEDGDDDDEEDGDDDDDDDSAE